MLGQKYTQGHLIRCPKCDTTIQAALIDEETYDKFVGYSKKEEGSGGKKHLCNTLSNEKILLFCPQCVPPMEKRL